MRRVLVTGGLGFIGSEVVRQLLARPEIELVTVADNYTYAADRERLPKRGAPELDRLSIAGANISNQFSIRGLVRDHDTVINVAAETHVDRAIASGNLFVETNVTGTFTLLEAVREFGGRFVQVSTDEVYGPTGFPVMEDASLNPKNPYAATKAAAEHMVLAYSNTYDTDVVITRGANTYGPWQYPEKFIPRLIGRALRGEKLPVYGNGLQMREWLHVSDHAAGIIAAAEKGQSGEIYNLGPNTWQRDPADEVINLKVAQEILRIFGLPEDQIEFVKDRPGHDKRYVLNSTKAGIFLDWRPRVPFLTDGLPGTCVWYSEHRDWWEPKLNEAEQFYGSQAR